MVADLETETHLLDFKRFGVAFTLLRLLGALIVIFAPINDLGYRRVSARRNLDQIKALFLGELESLTPRQNTELLPILINHTQACCPNGLIQAGIFVDTGVSFANIGWLS